MQALSHLPLAPDAPGLRTAGPVAAAPAAPGWQRALEQARANPWFDGGLPGSADGSGGGARSEMQGAGPFAPAATTLMAATAATAAVLEQRCCAAGPASADARASHGPITARHDIAALRIHVESAPQGFCVWLGITGNASSVARRSGAVLAQLQSGARAAPLRLARVVCNGHTLYVAGAAPVCPSLEEFP